MLCALQHRAATPDRCKLSFLLYIHCNSAAQLRAYQINLFTLLFLSPASFLRLYLLLAYMDCKLAHQRNQSVLLVVTCHCMALNRVPSYDDSEGI